MKLSTKIILPIILISALLMLLTSCDITPTVPDEGPEYTPGNIKGVMARPAICCVNSESYLTGDPISPNICDDICETQSTVDWYAWANVEVVLTAWVDSVEVELATTVTDENGGYFFSEVPPGKNYIITAVCPEKKDFVVKDVAEEVVGGSTYNAGIADAESTALGLVLEFLLDYSGLGPEDINLKSVIADSCTGFASFPKFKKLVQEVCRVLEDCGGVYEDSKVEDAVCFAAAEISGLDLGCSPGPGYTPDGGGTDETIVLESISIDPDPMELCVAGTGTTETETGTIVTTAHYSDDSSEVVTPDSYSGYDTSIVASVGSDGLVTSGDTEGTTTITVNYKEETAPVVVTVTDCTPPPTIKSISVVPDPMNLCLPGTGTPDSGTIVTTAHYSDGSSEVVTPDSYDGYIGIISVDAAGVVTPSSVGSTVVTVHFEGLFDTLTVNVANCSPYIPTTHTLTMIVSPTGAGTTTPSVGTHTYPTGTAVNISATPIGDYVFDHWHGDLSGSTNPTSLTINGNKTVTAYFVKESDPCADNHPPVLGGVPTGTVNLDCGETLTFTATATDVDGNLLSAPFSLTADGSGMTIDATSGYVSWTADCGYCGGTYGITVTVEDECGETDSETFTVVVDCDPPCCLPEWANFKRHGTGDWESTTDTYFPNVELANINPGYNIWNGTGWAGWCADSDHVIGNIWYNDRGVVCSIGAGGYWNEINWIINNREVSMTLGDVQEAIWHYTNGFSTSRPNSLILIAGADANSSFEPAVGDKYAVILDANITKGIQRIFIEAIRTCCCEASHLAP